MADLPSEDILNNNYEVKRYAVKPQRKKVNKPCTNCFFKILKFYKTYILVCTVFVATIIGIFYYGKFHYLYIPFIHINTKIYYSRSA